ncbi:MAG: stage II sporulation protein M, partial [Desulfitobacteriaceae bacterium]|nr:stage II sporulation protein M [Desulfitobacteriaceae bacterium]
IFLCGVVFGIFSINKLNETQVKELTGFVDGFIAYLPAASFDSGLELKHALGINLKSLFFTWFLGLTVIGAPLTLAVIFTRGFLLGFTAGFLILEKTVQGLLVVFLTVVPQNLLSVPVVILAAITSISFSLYLVRGKFIGKKMGLAKRFVRYSLVFSVFGLLAALAAVVQGYVTPSLVKAVFYFS